MAKDQRLTRLMGRPLALADRALLEAYIRRLEKTFPRTIDGVTFVAVELRENPATPEGRCLAVRTQDGRTVTFPALVILTALEQGVIDPIPPARDVPLE